MRSVLEGGEWWTGLTWARLRSSTEEEEEEEGETRWVNVKPDYEHR